MTMPNSPNEPHRLGSPLTSETNLAALNYLYKSSDWRIPKEVDVAVTAAPCTDEFGQPFRRNVSSSLSLGVACSDPFNEDVRFYKPDRYSVPEVLEAPEVYEAPKAPEVYKAPKAPEVYKAPKAPEPPRQQLTLNVGAVVHRCAVYSVRGPYTLNFLATRPVDSAIRRTAKALLRAFPGSYREYVYTTYLFDFDAGIIELDAEDYIFDDGELRKMKDLPAVIRELTGE